MATMTVFFPILPALDEKDQISKFGFQYLAVEEVGKKLLHRACRDTTSSSKKEKTCLEP